ncbi:MAG: metal ABC transporter permease [Myxococcota bacterium]
MPEMTVTWADFIGGWPIFRDAVLCGTVAGAALGLLGVYVVLRRMVFVAAVLSEVSGLGVALAFFVGMTFDAEVEPMLGAVVLCLLATVLFTVRPERVRLSREAVLAFAWVGAGGAAVVVGERITAEAHDIRAILFGSAVLVHPEDVWLTGATALLVAGLHFGFGRGLLFAGFDPDVARVHGLPVRLLDLALWGTVALTVSVATHALGALPVFAFSVLPAVAALLARPRMRGVFVLAALFGALAGGLGYVLAFFESLPVGAAQTLVAALIVVLALPLRLLGRGEG